VKAKRLKITKRQLYKNLEESVLENYKWFSKFSPVEKLRIAKRAGKFSRLFKNGK
jgi:hypothetical protein